MAKKVASALSAFLSVMLVPAMLMPVGCALQNRPDQVPATHTPKGRSHHQKRAGKLSDRGDLHFGHGGPHRQKPASVRAPLTFARREIRGRRMVRYKRRYFQLARLQGDIRYTGGKGKNRANGDRHAGDTGAGAIPRDI